MTRKSLDRRLRRLEAAWLGRALDVLEKLMDDLGPVVVLAAVEELAAGRVPAVLADLPDAERRLLGGGTF